ncbi:FadR/GntR family transcriptional regulator [Psychromarinibacter halotolerans]|uniref:FadR/GntR family transcriptional regulator n=1 Tax=Psychromarinibacter halotolerans TaxID=1775175 RepID=A0ABV7GXL7_9RHOB|nr:FCD domain-containing protein [Psychromarinibacter halotolerans]MDF0598294.1 FCD domain-containing protein [Psychromarinibacter halotolerans]
MPPATTRSTRDAAPQRLSRPAQVAEAIKSWVVEANMKPGDRLPNELEMIERFGMAKGTIREAMRILEAQGLVKTRTGPGGGSFVHEVSEARARALLGNYFYFKDLTVTDIYQLRLVLEPELAADLAGQLSADQLAALEANVARYVTPPKDAEEERQQHIASLDFHKLLASYAGNELLGFLIGFMAQMLSDLTVMRRLYEPRNYELWKMGTDHQIELITALRLGDGPRARAIMREHMEAAQAFMVRQEAEMERRFLAGR